jgi:hypothetical protein
VDRVHAVVTRQSSCPPPNVSTSVAYRSRSRKPKLSRCIVPEDAAPIRSGSAGASAPSIASTIRCVVTMLALHTAAGYTGASSVPCLTTISSGRNAPAFAGVSMPASAFIT